ncbi:peptidase M56 [Phenylobacterium hankyongense]|uniref:Peptidase M56 n=1 Tax=Phenylobacterium hankyongense TaxID=1813876 RepID=A0A328ATR1_9CAUL|nr:M56 family metallopeptidase [Phenylobacterium hankyongense]RAK58483.1 peptidase M56 [Phenylobacterium hankyongense]
MTNELLSLLLRINLAGGAAVLAVVAARLPARRWFGPEVAYRLWAAPPLAMAASLLPARVVDGAIPTRVFDLAHVFNLALGSHATPVLFVWLTGVAVAAGLLVRAQAAFARAARAGRAGPAVVGVLCPRVVMPAGDDRYTAEERALVRAHERTHIERRDPRAAALVAVLQCLAWFNPLAHLATRLVRMDQELACDAAVLRGRPGARALYARTLLKTQLASTPLPFGCHWGAHPLEVRIALLKRTVAPRHDLLGVGLVSGLTLAAGAAAWAAQPPAPRPITPALRMVDEGPSMNVLLVSAPARQPAGSIRR